MLTRRLQAFRSNRSGNVAIVFALASVPLFTLAGIAVDYGLATRLKVKLQAATDGTALALCQTPSSTSTSTLQTQASSMMTGYMGATNLAVDPLVVGTTQRRILLTTHIQAPTFFSTFTHIASQGISASAQCAPAVPKTFEIALALDTTGSMGNSSNGTSKMQAAQTAALNFVNYVHNNASFASDSRISIVPFAASVAVDPIAYRSANWIDQNGQSAYHWDNVNSANAAGFSSRFDIFTSLQKANANWAWAGCLEKLLTP